MNTAGVRPGDLVLVDGPQAKGSDGPAAALHRYHATVVAREHGGLTCRRLDGGSSFFVRARLVVGHWAKRKGGLA